MFENFSKTTKLAIPKTSFTGYEKLKDEGKVLALFDKQARNVSKLMGEGYTIFDQTPLFAMSGGQESDQGILFFKSQPIFLQDVRKDILEGYFLHAINTNEKTIAIDDKLKIVVDEKNRQLNSIHHSALHLTWETLLKLLKHPIQFLKLDQK